MLGFEETFRSVGLTLARSITFASHAFLFGLLPLLLLVVRPAFASLEADAWGKGRARVAARFEGMVQAALTATVIATAIALVLQFALVSEVEGGDITSEPVFSVLETRFGQLYLLRFPLVVGLAVLLLGRVREWSLSGAGDGGRDPGRTWWIGWGVLGFALLATTTLSGHAAVATPAAVAIINDLVHLTSGSIWFTGIVVLALVVPDGWRGREPEERVRLLAPVVMRFSTVALISITVIGVTGYVNSLLHLERLRDLWETTYGRPLLAKIVVYFLIVGLGAINHFYVRKRLSVALAEHRSDHAQSLFRRTIGIELAMALLLIGLSGFLVGEARTKDVPVVDSEKGVTAVQTP